MSIQLSRPTTPASSIRGLGPFRTPRSRPGQQSSQSRFGSFGSFISHDSRPVSRTSTRSHRRAGSAPEQQFATPKSQGTLHIDRQLRETTSRASSPPISGSHFPRPGHSIRSSLQTLARSGSFSLPKTPRGRRSFETPELIEDDGDHSDGSRFDLLPSDPFNSKSPIAILDIEEAPLPPPKPLLIIPPAQLIIPDELVEASTPVSEGSRTPTSARATMKSALNRMTLTGRPRLRLLSFIKELKSPVSAVEPEPSPPKLQLDLQSGPLFDVSAFQLQDLPTKRRSMRVEGHSLGHAAPPPLRIPPPPPSAPPLGSLPGPSALQLDLHGDFEGYILEESPTDSEQQPLQDRPQETVHEPPTPKEVPNWIVKFREELEELAGEALSITRLSDKLVLELPKEPGLSHRRTLIFQEADPDESTPELTSDTISLVSSQGRPPRPTRPPPPVPEAAPEESIGASDNWIQFASFTPPGRLVSSASLRSITSLQSNSTFDPNQPIPSIPDFESSYYLSSDDDHTIRTGAIRAQAHVFQPSLSKQEAIEEAIRKIQRKAEGSRLLVIQEDESDLESEASEDPIVIERGPTLIKHISNPFSSSQAPEVTKSRKVSLLRKRVLSRSLGSPKPAESAHSRSASLPTTSDILKEKNIIVAGRLPLNSRTIERELPSLPPAIAPKPHSPITYDDFYSTYRPPIYLAQSTPTFEVVDPRRRKFPAVYYPQGPIPLPYPTSSSQSSDFFAGL